MKLNQARPHAHAKAGVVCLHCGAAETSRWRPGPSMWTRKYSLCNVCYNRWRKQKLVLPDKEPTLPLCPALNTTMAYRRRMQGNKKRTFEEKMQQRTHLRHLLYSVFVEDPNEHLQELRDSVAEHLEATAPCDVSVLQTQLFDLYSAFDGTSEEAWADLEVLVDLRNRSLEENTLESKRVCEILVAARSQLAKHHRKVFDLRKRIGEATSECIDLTAAVAASPSTAVDPHLMQAAKVSERTDVMLERMSPKLDHEIAVLFGTLQEKKRRLPDEYTAVMQQCKTFRSTVTQKITEVRKWVTAHCRCPEQRIYRQYFRERMVDIPPELWFNDMAQLRKWRAEDFVSPCSIAVEENVEQLVQLYVYEKNMPLAVQHVRWLASGGLHTFFPKVVKVSFIGDQTVVMTQFVEETPPDSSGLAMGDFLRQLTHVFGVLRTKAASQTPLCFRTILYSQLRVSCVTRTLSVEPPAQTDPSDGSFVNVQTTYIGGPVERRAAARAAYQDNIDGTPSPLYNIGVLMHRYCYGVMPCMMTTKLRGSFAGIVRSLLGPKAGRPSLLQLQCQPSLLAPETDTRRTLINDNALVCANAAQEMTYRLFTLQEHKDYREAAVVVTRDAIFDDVMNYFIAASCDMNEDYFFSRIDFRIRDEEGVGNGVTLEVLNLFFEELSQHSMWDHGAAGTIAPSSGGTLRLCDLCSANTAVNARVPCRWCTVAAFAAVGRVLAIVMARRLAVRLPCSKMVTRYLCDASVRIDDVFDFDPTVCAAFDLMRDEKAFGKHGVVFGAADHDRASVLVTNASRPDFLQLKLAHDMYAVRQPWLDSLRRGFRTFKHTQNALRLLSVDSVHKMLFSHEECTPTHLARLFGYSQGMQTRKVVLDAFKRVVSDFSMKQCQQFLSFVTGSSVLPPGNLKHAGGHYIFVDVRGIPGGYPEARTCYKKLTLPLYLDDGDNGDAAAADLAEKFDAIFNGPDGMAHFTLR